MHEANVGLASGVAGKGELALVAIPRHRFAVNGRNVNSLFNHQRVPRGKRRVSSRFCLDFNTFERRLHCINNNLTLVL